MRLIPSARINELLIQASATPRLRLGQSIVNCMTSEELTAPWPELFFEECPLKAMEIFYGSSRIQKPFNDGALD